MRCPAAIDKLEALAAGGRFSADDVLFCTLNLDDREFAREIVDEHEWEHLQHANMDFETKEATKKAWGFSAVPFLVVVARDGRVLWSGPPPKDAADLEARVAEALTSDANAADSAAGDENANVSNAPPATTTSKPTMPMAQPLVLDEDF